MKKQKGFSLIELLIVVAIILIIAAIAIPNLMRARIAANDSQAAANIRTINSAEATYTATWGGGNYATLAQLGPGGTATCGTATAAAACLVDTVLGCGSGTSGGTCQKDQFIYEITVNSGSDYVVETFPASSNQGDKEYCSFSDGVIRMDVDPSATDPGLTTDAGCAAKTPI